MNDRTSRIAACNRCQRGVACLPSRLTSCFLGRAGARTGAGLVASFLAARSRSAGMNDAYAWGIWKTFNVMALTGTRLRPFAIGMAAWVFNRQKLHVVMRTALLSGFLFYASGLMLLGFDVGRPWNFWNVILPWRWNPHSPMLEVAVCMPVYCDVPGCWKTSAGSGLFTTQAAPRPGALSAMGRPVMRRIYPFMFTGAYVLPLCTSLRWAGCCCWPATRSTLLADAVAPLLYLLAAAFCADWAS